MNSAVSRPPRVILLGNYRRDGQESMQRFADLLRGGLRGAGLSVELLCPSVIVGRIGASSHFGIGKWFAYFDKFVLFPRQLQRHLKTAKRTFPRNEIVVHLCDHSNAYYTRFLKQTRHLVTCHDLLAVRSAHGEIPQNPTRWSGRKLQQIVLSGLNGAQHIVCVSDRTRQDVRRLTRLSEPRLSVIHNSLNYPYRRMASADATASLASVFTTSAAAELDRGFLLHVGGNQWYKNRMGVIEIYAELTKLLPSAPPLVLAGKPWNKELTQLIAERGLEKRVHGVVGCDNETLRALYSLANVMVFPSLAEGFGWPIVEAQACGCPVICSDLEPLPEVGGKAVVTHSPDEPGGFARKLAKLLNSESYRAELVIQGYENVRRFDTSQMISKYLEQYSSLVTDGSKPVGIKFVPEVPLD